MRGDDGHRRYETMAVAHVLGGLDSDEGRIFRSHLLECVLCRARVGELRAIASDLAGVERDERRERSAKAVETKRRQEAAADPDEAASRSRLPSRWLLLALTVALVALAAYTIVLRGNNQRWQADNAQLRQMTATLQHGEDLEVRFLAPDVEATAKVRGGRVAILLEGVEDGRSYGYYLLDDAGGSQTTVDRGPLLARDGQILQWFPVPRGTDRLLVTAPEAEWATDPDGEPILEVRVHQPAEEPASIGSA